MTAPEARLEKLSRPLSRRTFISATFNAPILWYNIQMTYQEREIPDMPMLFDIVPPIRLDWEGLLRMSLSDGRSALYRNLCIDDLVDRWRNERHIDTLNSPRLDAEIESVQRNTIPILEGTSERDPDSIQDTYRLAMRTAFLEPVVKIPAAFHDQRLWRTRETLTEDLVGIGARLLERAIVEIYNARIDKDFDAVRALRGVISELTAALLINIEQPASVATLPGSAFDDIYGKTDLHLHVASKKLGHLSLPVQVKSSGQHIDYDLPPEILQINMQDVSTKDTERIAHALMRKIYNQYKADSSNLADNDSQIITEANDNIIDLINHHVDGIFKMGKARDNQPSRAESRRNANGQIGKIAKQSCVA